MLRLSNTNIHYGENEPEKISVDWRLELENHRRVNGKIQLPFEKTGWNLGFDHLRPIIVEELEAKIPDMDMGIRRANLVFTEKEITGVEIQFNQYENDESINGNLTVAIKEDTDVTKYDELEQCLKDCIVKAVKGEVENEEESV